MNKPSTSTVDPAAARPGADPAGAPDRARPAEGVPSADAPATERREAAGGPGAAGHEALPRGIRRVDDPPLGEVVTAVADTGERRARQRKILRWGLTGLFAVAGLTKLAGLGFMVEAFRGWGYPPWAVYAVGAVELVAALLLATHKLRVGGALVMVIMAGALGTHLQAGEWLAALVPLVVLLAAWVLVLRAGPRPAASAVERRRAK